MPVFKLVNQDFFNSWSKDMAYVLGFFAADGCLTTNKTGGHYFSIQIKDLDHLKKIRKLLCSNHKITKRIHKRDSSVFYRIQIGSKDIWQDLHKLGMSEQKTKRLILPKIPVEFLFDFVRGYFDGDGGVWVGRLHSHRQKQSIGLQVYFTSSSQYFLNDLKNKLMTYKIIGSLYKRKSEAYVLRYASKSSIILYREMYKDKGLYLFRKKKIFNKFIKCGRSLDG